MTRAAGRVALLPQDFRDPDLELLHFSRGSTTSAAGESEMDHHTGAGLKAYPGLKAIPNFNRTEKCNWTICLGQGENLRTEVTFAILVEMFKNNKPSLKMRLSSGHLAQWLDCRPSHLRVVGLIPSMGLGLGKRLPIDVSLSYLCFPLSPSLPPFYSFLKKQKKKKRKNILG